MFNTLLAVFIGGGVGSVSRWYISLKLNPTSSLIPIGTLVVNLTGALIIGLMIALFNRMTQWDPVWKMLLTTGLCGGLTTFSTFSLEVVYMLQDGRFGAALLNIALNLIGSIAMTMLGFMLVSWYSAH
ncbi:fluoride efflux transporter CrcB [Serratia sp. M24T3]|uniref:Fluoride-specific ion channel FluC n=1 Tax=Rouxiella sp. WC2420 TaxID=3234145 RepID=A0AB39VPT8_9GAMM|nr:fluoride efflux transporter CrcB [Serratia sp. M24T3]EIC84541.1 chromosome condensation membrane protein [Serratia sp. M24T3]